MTRYHDAYPYPTRAQWVGLCMVAASGDRPSAVAGVGISGKRTAASLERRGWIKWVKPEGARFAGWVLTADGVVAKHAGDTRFARRDGVG